MQQTQGLTSQQAEENLRTYGTNEIPDNTPSNINKFVHLLFSPITFLLILAAALSYFMHKTFDFYLISFLIFFNILIRFWQENKADKAISKLNQHLISQVKVFRDGSWQTLDTRKLVPGDIVELGAGEIIPADGFVVSANKATVDESALTGESLPKDKESQDKLFSGSFVTSGLIQAQITATGKQTHFAKTLLSVETTRKRSVLEKDVIRIAIFLSIFSLITILIMTTVFLIQNVSLTTLLTLDLSLLIAGIPISLPTVMTLIIELGVLRLAKKEVIVRRLSALEDVANVNLLLTDKTGTLTRNEITIHNILPFNGFTKDDVLRKSYFPASQDTHNFINKAVLDEVKKRSLTNIEDVRIEQFTPLDLKKKRSATIINENNKKLLLYVGAPQNIIKLSKLSASEKEHVTVEVDNFAKKGYRTLAVAQSEDTSGSSPMQLVGFLALSDTIHHDTASTIEFMNKNGIGVVVVTGDNLAISKEIIKQIHLEGKAVISRDEFIHSYKNNLSKETFLSTAAFAEILPEDKLTLVNHAKKYFVVAANGDGVNDIPAIKSADVGIAVKNAVDALKSTADIVLLSDRISVIKDAIIEGRRIFSRVYSYSVYRISESIRLIITIAILGILYRVYPLTPLQLILIALLNDIPIISLAYDRVKVALKPATIKDENKFIISSIYGLIGVLNSILMYLFLRKFTTLSNQEIQTIYFLKLTISGHLLIYVARTKERWFSFLPSKQVIAATTITQLIATFLAFTGLFMPTGVAIPWIILIWVWAFFWMQITELCKYLYYRNRR